MTLIMPVFEPMYFDEVITRETLPPNTAMDSSRPSIRTGSALIITNRKPHNLTLLTLQNNHLGSSVTICCNGNDVLTVRNCVSTLISTIPHNSVQTWPT